MDLATIQKILNTHGFPCGAADGVMGRNTQGAVGRFQTAYCGPGGWLDIDGKPGPRTQEALEWTHHNNALVTHFSIPEIACKHCGRAYVRRELLAGMFALREKFGPVRLVSCFRCEVHNARIKGGARNSQHLSGTAFDPTNLTIGQIRSVGIFTYIGSPARDRDSNPNAKATHADVRAGNPSNPVIFYDASIG